MQPLSLPQIPHGISLPLVINIISNLIIQWGYSTIPTEYAGIVYLPTSFSNTTYHLVAFPEINDIDFINFDVACLSEHKFASNCLIRSTQQNSPVTSWIAIGY